MSIRVATAADGASPTAARAIPRDPDDAQQDRSLVPERRQRAGEDGADQGARAEAREHEPEGDRAALEPVARQPRQADRDRAA